MAGVTLDKVREGSTAQRPIDGERADLADEAWLAQAEVLVSLL